MVGQDPLRIEAVVDLMHRGTMIYGRRGLGMFAISGIEIALWDLAGKAYNVPMLFQRFVYSSSACLEFFEWSHIFAVN